MVVTRRTSAAVVATSPSVTTAVTTRAVMPEHEESLPLSAVRDKDHPEAFIDGVDDGLGGPADGGHEGRGRNGGAPGYGPEEGPRSRPGYFPVYNPAIPPTHHGGKVPLDVNMYATKKTIAQGMMDLALLTANANQLRYVLESGSSGGMYYYLNIVLISGSIFMQMVIGVALIILGRYNISKDSHALKADILNNWIVLGVFLISVVNVFVSAFGIQPLDGLDPVLIRNAVLEAQAEMNPPLEG